MMVSVKRITKQTNNTKQEGDKMTVTHNGRKYEFRACDTRDTTLEALQRAADAAGYMQYEPRASWLVVPGIGYGWEV